MEKSKLRTNLKKMKKEYIYLMLLIVGVAVIYFVIKSIGKKPPTTQSSTTTGGNTVAPSDVVSPATVQTGVQKNYWIAKGGKIYAPDKGDSQYPPTFGYTWSDNPLDDFKDVNSVPIFTATVDASLGTCKVIAKNEFTQANGTKIVGFILEYPNGKRRGIFAPYLYIK